MCRVMVLVLMMFVITTKSLGHDDDADVDPLQKTEVSEFLPYTSTSDEEYIRHIHSMINAYRGDRLGDRLIIETDALIDTKFRTWKRNADMINSLLAIPKGLNEAGR